MHDDDYTEHMDAAALRSFCLRLPGCTEAIQWGDNRVFKVGGKMFAISGYEDDSCYSFKVDPERFLELSDLPGVSPAPYLARHRWVQIRPDHCLLSRSDLEDLIVRSYELVLTRLPKRLQREIAAA